MASCEGTTSSVDELSTAVGNLHVGDVVVDDDSEVQNVVTNLVDSVSTPEKESRPENDENMGQKTSKRTEEEFRDASAPPLEEVPVVASTEPLPPVEEAQEALPSSPERARASGSAVETCAEEDEFKTRLIQFNGKTVRVVMQTRNGPCPLIAVINALILLGKLKLGTYNRTINGHANRITRNDMTDIIGEFVSDGPEAVDSTKNFEYCLNDVLNLIPSLGRGLDVNVRFNDVEGFEYTGAMVIFEMVKLKIYHTWKVEEHSEYANVVGDLTYNQVAAQALENVVLRDFLEETANQTTYAGLFGVRDAMNDGALAIVFRNNHFHTAHKGKGQVHLLCTDEGFLGSSAVWETLHSIEGDSDLLDCDFRPIAQQQTHNSTPTETASSTDSDYELAKRLQEEYNRSAAGGTQQQQQPAMPPPQSRSSQSSSTHQSPSQTPSYPPQKRDKGNCLLM